jgi:large subunit ribosomal protein L25
MAAARPTLTANRREVTGKHVAHLRRDGLLPGVVYGRGVESSNVSVDSHEFEVLRRRAGPNTLIDLSVDGKKSQPVLVNGVQIHPVTRRPLHVDLFLVRMTEELTVDVPLIPRGIAPAVDTLNGTLLHVTEALRVKALPDHLPQSIGYDVAGLVDFEAAVHVRDLEIPDDVTLLTDTDEVVAKVLPPRIEIEEVPAEAEELEEGAEAAEVGEGVAPAAEGAPESTGGEAEPGES